MPGAIGASRRPKRLPIITDYNFKTVFGNHFPTQSTANTNCAANEPNTYRFMAPRSGTVTGIQFYIVLGVGYSGGTEGIAFAELRTDDGSAMHLPSSTVLATTTQIVASTLDPGGSGDVSLNFITPAPITANTWYHLYFRNADANSANYYGLDVMYDYSLEPGIGDQFSDTNPWPPFIDSGGAISKTYVLTSWEWQFAQLHQPGGGSNPWRHRPGFFTTFDLRYNDGTSCGYGYQGGISDLTCSGTTKFAWLFSSRESSKAATSLWASLTRVSGSDPITATLIDLQTGSTVATLTSRELNALQTTLHANWVSFPITSPIILQSGGIYRLEFSCPGTSTYLIHTLSPGYRNGYGYGYNCMFEDGHAITNPAGAGWTTGIATGIDGGATWASYDFCTFFITADIPGNTAPLVFSPAHMTGVGQVTTNGTVLTNTNASFYNSCLGSRILTAGKYYWEMTSAFSVAGTTLLGVASVRCNFWRDSALLRDTSALAWQDSGGLLLNNVSQVAWPAWTTGQRICLALDLTNAKIWGRVTTSGTWWGAASGADPTVPSSGFSIPSSVLVNVPVGDRSTVAKAVTVAAATARTASTCTIFTSNSGTPPAGFSAP